MSTAMRRFWPAAAFILSAASPPGALAQASGSELSEVVVIGRYVPVGSNTATKSDVPVLETPQSISVITREQIELLNFQSIEETVRYTAGITGSFYGDDNRFDWLTLRGFSPTTYVDGLQLPSGTFAISRLDVSGLESVEILKGPSSSLYGAMPPGGLVNLISRRPRQEFGVELGLQTGSYDHYQTNVDLTGSLNDSQTVYYRLGALYRDSGSIVRFADNQRQLLQPALTFAPNDRFRLTILTHFQKDEGGTTLQFLPEAGTLLPNPNGQLSRSTYVSDPNYDVYDRDEYHVGYVFDYDISDTLRLHQGVRYTDVAIVNRQIYGGGYFEDAEQRLLGRFTFYNEEEQRNLTTDTSLQFRFGSGRISHTLLAGLDYRRSEGAYPAGFDFGPPIDMYAPVYFLDYVDPPLFSDSQSEDYQVGVYLQEHAKIDRWVVTLGLRYDDYHEESTDFGEAQEDTDQDDTTGRIGFNYLFDSGIAPYVSWSRSFQPQSGFDGPTGKPFVPTTGEQYEAGVKYQPAAQQGLVSLAYYDLRQQNVPTSTPGVPFSREQEGEIKVTGVELEGVARLNDAFSINGAYTYTHAIVSKSKDPTRVGTALLLTPEHQASLFVDYTLQGGPLANLGFGGGVRYVDETFGNPGEVGLTPSYTLVDALVHYESGPWKFTLNVNNLFDEEYLGSCDGFGSCYWGYARNINASFSYRWGPAYRR